MGLLNLEIAERLGVSDEVAQPVCRVGLDGLLDEPRPGRPRTSTDAPVEAVVIKTRESKLNHATRWSTRSDGGLEWG